MELQQLSSERRDVFLGNDRLRVDQNRRRHVRREVRDVHFAHEVVHHRLFFSNSTLSSPHIYKREPLSTKSHSSAPPADVFLFLLFLLQTLLVVAAFIVVKVVVVKVRRGAFCVLNAPWAFCSVAKKERKKEKKNKEREEVVSSSGTPIDTQKRHAQKFVVEKDEEEKRKEEEAT